MISKQPSISILCFIILFIFPFQINAQIALSKHDSLFFNISGSALKLQPLDNRAILLPQHIASQRRQSSVIPANLNEETDNPLIHGAAFLALNLKYSLQEKFHLYFDLITEHRGASYGVLNTKNIIVFPRIYATASDTLHIFNQSFPVNIQIGNLVDTFLQDRLLFYNTYKHGLEIDVSKKKIGLRLSYYPDQHNGIGLNVKEYAAIAPYAQLTPRLRSSIGLLFMERATAEELNESPFLLRHTTILKLNKYSFYLQGSMRLTSNKYVHNRAILKSNGLDKFAFVLGTKFKFKRKKLSATSAINIRFYGKVFNIGHRNPDIAYRDTTQNTLYANTVGENLYPLDYYYSNFDQWAVHTEYQNMNVFNINLTSKIKYELTRLHSLQLDLDITSIYAENQPAFTYAFYELGFAYHLNKKIDATIFVTNKGMNLDVHYPTFYSYKNPYVGIKVIKRLEEHWLSRGQSDSLF